MAPTGYTIGADGDIINLYYRAADSSIALAHGSIRALLAWLKANGHPEHTHDRRHKQFYLDLLARHPDEKEKAKLQKCGQVWRPSQFGPRPERRNYPPNRFAEDGTVHRDVLSSAIWQFVLPARRLF